jgi:hypothetical protein
MVKNKKLMEGLKMKCAKLFTLSLIVLVLVCSIGTSVSAESSRDSVEKLLLLTKQDQIINQTFEQFKPLILQQFQQMSLTKEQSQIIDKYMGKMLDVMKEEMNWDQIKGDFIQIYTSVYTEEEIQEMIKFYQSPVGRKLIEKTPLIVQQSMALSQKYVQNILPKIQELTQEMAEEIKNNSKDVK